MRQGVLPKDTLSLLLKPPEFWLGKSKNQKNYFLRFAMVKVRI